jgi:hypothetical protein
VQERQLHRAVPLGGSSQNISDSDLDVSEDLSFESLFLKVAELENDLCNQDKLLC